MLHLNKLPKIRNRDEARVFAKVLSKSGKTEKQIADIIELTKKTTLMYDAELRVKFKEHIAAGDKVKLNVDKIRSHPDWDKLQDSYKEFIFENVDTVFTAHYDDGYSDNPSLVLLDDGKLLYDWLFWDGDLLVLDESDGQYKELHWIEQKMEG